MDFRIVHDFQDILCCVGTQILDLDLVGFETVFGHSWRLLDLFQDEEDVLDIAVQKVERLIYWESHGPLTLLSAAVVIAKRLGKNGWQSYEVVIDRPREPSSDLCIVVRQPNSDFSTTRGGE